MSTQHLKSTVVKQSTFIAQAYSYAQIIVKCVNAVVIVRNVL